MLKVVSLYTGAGGLDLGFEAAGFETAAAIEFDKWACQTLRHNRNWPVFEQDIHEVTSRKIASTAGVKFGDLDVLIGGPPCQPFSKSAYWANGDTNRLDDPRADTLSAYLRVLKDLRPKVFLIENVFGLAFKGKDEGLRLLENTIKEINKEKGTNYSFCYKVLNTADYGVPQVRERIFIIGARDGSEFSFPEPTHYNPDKIPENLFNRKPWLTAWDSIGDLSDTSHPNLTPGGKWGDLLPSIPEGGNYLHHTDRGKGKALFGWRTRYWSFLLKLSKSRPSWTIQAQPGSAIGPFHWKSRRLSVREICRLQTIPDDYEICGNRTEIQRQVGNAVPSLMGEVLALEIRKQLLGKPLNRRKLKLLPNRSDLIPPAERLRPINKKYHSLIGEYKAHPGNGKGPAAASKD